MDLFSPEMTTFKWILRILLWAVIFYGAGCLFVPRENRNKLYAFIAAWALELIAMFTLGDYVPAGDFFFVYFPLLFNALLFLFSKLLKARYSFWNYVVANIMSPFLLFWFIAFAFESGVIGC